MTSRCINALNDLDEISTKIFYKYSKTRLKEEVEGKVKESKSRAERNCCLSSPNSRNSFHSSNSTRIKTNKSSQSNCSNVPATKSTSTPKTIKTNSGKRLKTPGNSSKKVNKVPSPTISINDEDNPLEQTAASPSVFGKHTPGTKPYNSGKWFNFENGVNQGVIDSFACDDLNEKALCYKVDLKESKPVPKLLHHRLEVRIGKNGQVKNEDSGMKQESLVDQDRSDKKTRTAPLSWQEQLNWESARVVAPRQTPPKKSEDQGLCETHPVIYHPVTKHRVSKTTNISNEATAAYRMYLGRKLLTSDRRNLTCGGKCITSIELQDATDEVGVRKQLQETLPRTKSQESDFDKMDMSNTIDNINNIYRTNSEESAKNMPSGDGVVENPCAEDRPTELDNQRSSFDEWTEKELERVKMSKRVSFKDEVDAISLSNRTKSEREISSEENESKETAENPSVKRPTSSQDRLESNADQEMLPVRAGMPRRPCTAPPCSPRIARDTLDNIKSSPIRQLLPIRVPTASEREVLSETEENENKQKRPDENHTVDFLDVENERASISSESRDDVHVPRACKSAPTSHVSPIQDEPILRSKSTTTPPSTTNKLISPKPTEVTSNSTVELPSNLPPAQALVEFRKKIREDLAKETADLQLDIQQLYLKHHSSNQ